MVIMMEIVLEQKANLKGYTMIEGFPGAGLVGPMAISYLIEKMELRYIGHIESDDFPPLVAVHRDVPMPPVRVYASDKAKLVTVLAEFAIPLDITYELTNKLYEFIKKNGIARIVSIGGMPAPQQTVALETVFGIASNDTMRKEVQKAGLKQIGEGVATGVSALMLMKSASDGTPDISILVPVDPNILDPIYAELAIKSLNKLLSLKVDVNELDKEAKEVEAKVRDLIKRGRDVQEMHKKSIDQAGPSMYA